MFLRLLAREHLPKEVCFHYFTQPKHLGVWCAVAWTSVWREIGSAEGRRLWMDSDMWRSKTGKCKASSLWVNGLRDKAKRRQKLRRHCCFGVCISGPSFARSTKVMQCEWCRSISDGCTRIFILSLFIINFILHSDNLSLYTVFEDRLDKTPGCALLTGTSGNEPKRRSEEAFVPPSSQDFFSGHPCCTGFPSSWGQAWKNTSQLSSGDPRYCSETCFGAACTSTCISSTDSPAGGYGWCLMWGSHACLSRWC